MPLFKETRNKAALRLVLDDMRLFSVLLYDTKGSMTNLQVIRGKVFIVNWVSSMDARSAGMTSCSLACSQFRGNCEHMTINGCQRNKSKRFGFFLYV